MLFLTKYDASYDRYAVQLMYKKEAWRDDWSMWIIFKQFWSVYNKYQINLTPFANFFFFANTSETFTYNLFWYVQLQFFVYYAYEIKAMLNWKSLIFWHALFCFHSNSTWIVSTTAIQINLLSMSPLYHITMNLQTKNFQSCAIVHSYTINTFFITDPSISSSFTLRKKTVSLKWLVLYWIPIEI